jgi:hypothetical protein
MLFEISEYDIKQASLKGDKYFFSEGANRFFKSLFIHCTAHNKVLNTAAFITSEKFESRGYSNSRKYTIREINLETGRVSTIGEFQEYWSVAVAKSIVNSYRRYLEEKGELSILGWMQRVSEIEAEEKASKELSKLVEEYGNEKGDI